MDCSWKLEIYETLSAIEALEDNWNDNSASKFCKALILQAKQIIDDFPSEFEIEIFPTARDSIQFEYETDDIYLEFELFETDSSVYFSNHEKTLLDLDHIKTTEALKFFINTIKYNKKEKHTCLKM